MRNALARKSIRLGNSFAQQLAGKSGKIDVDGRADWDTVNECAN
jgi:hypothetical protein